MKKNNNLSKDGGGAGGPSDARPSSERPKDPHQRGGWVRGHQKDGGGYAKEMPKCITGKDIVLHLHIYTVLHTVYEVFVVLKNCTMTSVPCVIAQLEILFAIVIKMISKIR